MGMRNKFNYFIRSSLDSGMKEAEVIEKTKKLFPNKDSKAIVSQINLWKFLNEN